MKLTRNVGLLDAVLRVGTGTGLIYTGFISELINDSFASNLLGVVGIIVFASGAAGRCPLYDLIGFNSRNSEPQ